MSKLDALIQEKQKRSEEWKAQKTAERDELNAWSDNAILTATMDPNAYLHYLDVQADNPRYSASNILLAMEQNPEITYINSLQGWNALGRSVKREESGLMVELIFLHSVVPGTATICYEERNRFTNVQGATTANSNHKVTLLLQTFLCAGINVGCSGVRMYFIALKRLNAYLVQCRKSFFSCCRAAEKRI